MSEGLTSDYCMAQRTHERGALLIEILVAVTVFAAIAAIGSQALIVSLRSNKTAAEKGEGAQLLSEMIRGVRSLSDESWQNLYGLTKDTAHYYPSLQGGKWTLTSGDEIILLGQTRFSRYFTVANVSRDPSTRAVETSYDADHDDPATQKITAIVSASTTGSLSVSVYLSRWRNQVCGQTSWSSSGSSGARNCPDTTYVDTTNITAGDDLQLCSGGC